MIEFSQVQVGYGKKQILHNVTFTANRAQITIVLGKNGCGKSTLLRAAAGLLRHGGQILLDGREVSTMSSGHRARQAAVMPQMLHSPEVTVRTLVSYGRQPYAGVSGILSQEDRRIVEQVMEKTEIAPLAEAYLHQISGGERQKAYFAMLLAQNAPNLLLDEPGAHLDSEYKKNLSGFLCAERNRGKTVIAVLHDINHAIALADQIVVLNHGTIQFCGSSADFCAGDLPETLFGLQKYRCTAVDRENAAEKFFYA